MKTLAERNQDWKGDARFFIHPKSGGRFWRIEVNGAQVTVQHGTVGGKLTSATETFKGKNLGKANEITPEQDALNRAKVQIEKKHREGYDEHVRRKGVDMAGFYFANDPGYYYKSIEEKRSTEIDFDNLPTNLCFYKPDNNVQGSLEKLMQAGKAWYTRKRNGMAMIIAKGPTGKVQIYSRRMHKQHDKESKTAYTWNDRFPHIVEEAQAVMAPNSIMLGELVVGQPGATSDRDDFTMTQRMVKGMTDEVLALQKETGRKPGFYVWDIAFWDGENWLATKKAGARFLNIEKITDDLIWLWPIKWYTNSRFATPEAALEFAKAEDWEGFVVVDPDAIYGEKGFNFKGKPDRPRSGCGKLKPTHYDDFVVEFDPDNGVGEWSTKDKYASGDQRGIKNVILYQYDRRGEKQYISELGVGLTEKMKRELADPKLFPQVWEVSYKDRRYVSQGDDTNALDFSSYERTRWTKVEGGDKEPEECVNDNL